MLKVVASTTRRSGQRRARAVDYSPAGLLQWVAQTHPELATLAAALRKPDGMDTRWWHRFASAGSGVHPRKKAVLLRAYLGDATLRRGSVTAPVTNEGLTRIARYLQTCPWIASLPSGESGAEKPEAIPSRLRQLFPTLPHKSPALFLARCVVVAAWQATTGGDPDRGAFAHLPRPLLRRELRPFLDRRVLLLEEIHAAARRYDTNRRPSTWCDWYFNTGIRALDVRNLVVYAAQVLKGDRQGGRIQNTLPLQLAKTLNLPPRSIPDTLAALDVIHLVATGVIDLRKVQADEDFMGLRALFDTKVPWKAFWPEAVSDVRDLFLLTGQSARTYTTPASQFDTGLLFHPARILGLVPGRTARLAAFRPYYQAVIPGRLRTLVGTVTSAEVDTLLRTADRVAPEIVEGIRLRGTANILMRLLTSRQSLAEAVASLPPVARFAMGEAEPIPTFTRPRRTAGAGKRAIPHRRRPPPLLAELGLDVTR